MIPPFSWPPIPASGAGGGGGGGGGGTADALATTDAPVDVSGASPPDIGQVLMAIDDTHAIWKVPGLHYDPAIRFNMDLSGQATIEPGTWGFVQTVPPDVEGAPIIFVVSSLTAPPVDSRFGLYLAPSLATTVEVHLIGASQIFALDGVLGSTCVLFPGAFYEWVFYHEAGVAIWGLVSDTARMAQRFEAPWNALADPRHAVFPITKASEPPNGSTLIYRNVGASPTAAWELPALAGDAQHGVRGGDTLHALATTLIAGFQSGGDKTKLDGIESGAQVVTFGRVQTALASASSSVALNAQRITGVADPSAAQDVATKNYVDASVWKEPVRACTFGTPITLSGTQTIDGVALIAGDRCVVVSQVSPSTNGLYVVSAGAWARSTDADTTPKLKGGTQVIVNEGTTYKDTVWCLTTNDPIVLGTTSLAWNQSGGPKAINLPQPLSPSGSATAGTAPRWALEDHVHALYAQDPTTNGFRLSNNAASLPIDNASVSTITLAPHTSNRIALSNNGTDWYVCTPSSSVTIAVTGQTAGVPCDVFAVFGSLTAVSLELLPWTNGTTRATAIVQSTVGVWVKTGAATRRYLGTILPNAATTFAHASTGSDTTFPICGVWNQDNQILGAFSWTPTFDNWTVPSANTWLQINGQSSAKIQYVQGQSSAPINARHVASTDGSAGGSVSLGVDSTSAPSGIRNLSAIGTGVGTVYAEINQYVAAGAHAVNGIANGGSTSVRFFGAHAPMQGGISANLWF